MIAVTNVLFYSRLAMAFTTCIHNKQVEPPIPTVNIYSSICAANMNIARMAVGIDSVWTGEVA